MKASISPQIWKPPRAAPPTTPAPLSVRTVRLPGTGPEDVLVAETTGYRLLSMDLPSGELTEAVALPGFPDNIATGSDGLVWVAVGSPRDPMLDFLLDKPPVLRKAAWALPDALQPQPKNVITIQAYTTDGRLVHDLRGKDPDFSMPAGVREHAGKVWFGSLLCDYLADFDTRRSSRVSTNAWTGRTRSRRRRWCRRPRPRTRA